MGSSSGAGVVPRRIDLPGGRTLGIRSSLSSDVDDLTAMYDSLGEEDLYRRFFQAHAPARSVVEHVLGASDRGGVGLVAVLSEADGTTALVGEASYELLPDGSGEIGITVVATARGWLGPYLLDVLVGAARARGVDSLQAEILAENRRMLAMMRARGYAVVDHYDRPSIVRVVIGTSDGPVWPGPHRRSRLLVEIPGGRWHATEAARSAGFEVLACPGPRSAGVRCPALEGRPCPLAADADVVVEALPESGGASALADAHARLHPAVPVCLELGPDDAGPPGATAVRRGADDTVVVGLLQRLARPVPSAP